MRSPLGTIALIATGAILVLVYLSAYTVTPRDYALPLRFGEPQPAKTQPGLYWKWPFIENVEYINKQVLDLDSLPQEVIASDQKRLKVDAFARYRVSDPLRFFQTSRSEKGAELQLSSILSSAVRRVLGQSTFAAVVRDQRTALMEKIRAEVNREAGGLGIEVVDVRIRGADLPQANSEAVYKRMQSQRQTEAQQIRSQGTQQAQIIRSDADRQVAKILGEARGKAAETTGQADSARIKILADAYNKDPEFFQFYLSMRNYVDAMKPDNTQVFISPDWDYFRYLRSPAAPTGAPAPAASPPAPPAQ
ncbi:protease modulator HflC [Labrys portucalensis]|uniref:Protein HflC n=1 Tax=Labrys neptuniae TaxID=376174 RepID=A0ABV3PH93_9HYPH|nr:protease modulator HflC [Labrys neptuniae]MDT3380628.1 protease modulator HflC [Labrys neptuniae]